MFSCLGDVQEWERRVWEERAIYAGREMMFRGGGCRTIIRAQALAAGGIGPVRQVQYRTAILTHYFSLPLSIKVTSLIAGTNSKCLMCM